MTAHEYNVVVVGSGAGGGAVAERLGPLAEEGRRVLVLEQGARLAPGEFTGNEIEMAAALYHDGGGFLTSDGAMTLAFGRTYGGSTVVYTGTSLIAPERVIRAWNVPGIDHADVVARARRYMTANHVYLLPPDRINDNNRLFLEGSTAAGYRCEQFPVNVDGCLGSSLCNLGCPNLAKQGTHRVQLPAAERAGVEVVTRAEALRIGERELTVDVGHPKSYFVDRAAEEGFVLETCMYFPFTTAKNLTGFGDEHARMMAAFPRLQMILVLACDHAVAGNRIDVARDGSPVVHYRFTSEVVDSMLAGTRAATRIFFSAGALRVHAPTARPHIIERVEATALDHRITAAHFLPNRTTVSAAHLMGGCGMGRSAADSVTDAWGRVHGVPWLRVADSSLFPDSLEINPYVTVMALADRVGEGVVRELG